MTKLHIPVWLARIANEARLRTFLPILPRLVLALGMMCLPALSSAQSAAGQPDTPGSGSISGTVKDNSGSAVPGAIVTLESASSTVPRTAITDQAGAFRFSGLDGGKAEPGKAEPGNKAEPGKAEPGKAQPGKAEPGKAEPGNKAEPNKTEPANYRIKIAAAGFAVWTAANVPLASGDNQPSLSAVLQVASTSSSVDVTLATPEQAREQLKTEEKQRVLGVFPDFLVSYSPNPAPLTAAQKLHLGWKIIVDPVSLVGTAISAGIDEARNNHPEFGQGAEGYAKRFGAQYANRVSHVMIGRVVMQSIFHQDPRYFYKGTGSFGSRALYAIGTAFVAKSDKGQWQFDYSDVLGGIASHEISTLYYPTTSRPLRRAADEVLLGFAGRAENNLFHELFLRHFTTHVPRIAAGLTRRIIPDGTPVSLISVDDWTANAAANGGPVAFTLAEDVRVDGVVVASIGSQAWGHATFMGDDKTMQVGLDNVQLKLGDTSVPLRRTPMKESDAALEYHRLENSRRVSIVLYVAGNVTLPPAR